MALPLWRPFGGDTATNPVAGADENSLCRNGRFSSLLFRRSFSKAVGAPNRKSDPAQTPSHRDARNWSLRVTARAPDSSSARDQNLRARCFANTPTPGYAWATASGVAWCRTAPDDAPVRAKTYELSTSTLARFEPNVCFREPGTSAPMSVLGAQGGLQSGILRRHRPTNRSMFMLKDKRFSLSHSPDAPSHAPSASILRAFRASARASAYRW